MSSIRNQAIVYFNKANELYKLGQYSKALDNYQKTIDYDSSFNFSHLWKSKTILQLGEYDKGINYFIKRKALFQESRLVTYIIQLSEILLNKGAYTKALELTNKLEVSFSKEHQFDYLRILLANNKVNEVIHQVINIPYSLTLIEQYGTLLTDSVIPTEIIQRLGQEKIAPIFFDIQNKLKLFKSIEVNHEEYQKILNQTTSLIQAVQKDRNIDYHEKTQELEGSIKKLQELLLNYGRTLLKTNSLIRANRVNKTLQEMNYETKNLDVFKKEIKTLEKIQTKRIVKFSLIGILVISVIVTSVHFINASIKKSNSYSYAIESDRLTAYNSYLNTYGNHEEIHRLRERKLYRIAQEKNTTKDINALIYSYPNSKYLKIVSLNIKDDSNSTIGVFGAQSENSHLRGKSQNTFTIPLGCVVGISITASGKIPVKKYFTVASNMIVTEQLYNNKTLLLHEDFNSIKKGWNVFEESEKSSWSTKYKGVKINNGSLELYHQYSDNKFVMSTLYFGKLKRNINFEIIAKIQRNGNDDGTFVFFGATKRAFNYLGFGDYGSYIYGYNNWDNSNENWVKENGSWQRSNAIATGNYSTNTIQIIKKQKNLEFIINNSSVGSSTLKKWYGNRIGFGINNNTHSKINELTVYQLHEYRSAEFTKNNLYFCSVGELNVRKHSSPKDSIITTIKRGEPVKYLGQVGEKKVNATFNDIYSPNYYYKVELLNGSTGWVHGGGLQTLKTKVPLSLLSFKEKKNIKQSNLITN